MLVTDAHARYTAMAGFAAYMKIDGFNILPVSSISMAATTFVGQNFGAGKIDRVKKGTFVTLGMCIVYTILTGILQSLPWQRHHSR